MKRLTKGLNHESNAFKHFNTDGIDYPRYLAKWPTENGYMGRVNIFRIICKFGLFARSANCTLKSGNIGS